MLHILKKNYADHNIAMEYVLDCYVSEKHVAVSDPSLIVTNNKDTIWAFDINQEQFDAILNKKFAYVYVIGSQKLDIPINNVGKSVTVLNTFLSVTASASLFANSIVNGSIFGYHCIDALIGIKFKNEFVKLMNDIYSNRGSNFRQSLDLAYYLEYNINLKDTLIPERFVTKDAWDYRGRERFILRDIWNYRDREALELILKTGKSIRTNLERKTGTIQLVDSEGITYDDVNYIKMQIFNGYYLQAKPGIDVIFCGKKTYVREYLKGVLTNPVIDYQLTKFDKENWYTEN